MSGTILQNVHAGWMFFFVGSIKHREWEKSFKKAFVFKINLWIERTRILHFPEYSQREIKKTRRTFLFLI